ncbi:MAG: ATP-binding protein [Methanococcaceae archaeon]
MDEERILDESARAEHDKAKRAAELVIAIEEKEKREAELLIANEEKAKRVAELIIANEEKEKRVAELVIANEEKEKRVAELVIANEEKAKQAAGIAIAEEEKAKRVAELVIANEEKAKRVAELVIANEEKANRIAELVLTTNELQQCLQSHIDKDLFISILAHDLRNPFTALIGISDLLIEKIRVYNIDETEVLLNYLKNASVDTLALLEDLLAWTSSQSGNMPFNPQILDFSNICKSVLESLSINAEAKSISIKISTIGNVSVFADIDMLKTILRNLVSNAIKFTNKGGTITINAGENSEYVIISVEDNGIGIMPDKLTKLFEISHRQTTKGTEKECGTGLGLVLCKEFVEKHAGKIWVESEFGKGSNFKFTLPVSGISQ